MRPCAQACQGNSIFKTLRMTSSTYCKFSMAGFTGMLQREHPGIAISVKTRQAIRTILNNARDVIHELKGGGMLDEAEAAKLESVR